MAIEIPNNNKKFKILPIPKYLKIRKNDKEIATTNPLLLFSKIAEAVNKIARKVITKNINIAPGAAGSTK